MKINLGILCAVTVLATCFSASSPADGSPVDRISKPNVYQGYSDALYADDYDLSSQYVEVRDGTKLAIDIYRPKDRESGMLVETPLPVVWMHTPYNRRFNGNRDDLTVEHYAGTAIRLVKYGYVVATADFRGLHASFGQNQNFNRGEWISAARYDAYDITEWLAKQSWSNGNIGMWGCSATGGSQIQAATTAPPHLKAMFPMSFEFDIYDFRVPGGIQWPSRWTRQPGDPLPHEARDALAAPVDADSDGSLLKDASAGHAGTIESVGQLPFRDSLSTTLTDAASRQWWIKSSPTHYLDEINASGIAMYMAVNWDEGYTKPGPFFAINNFTVPSKLVIGPRGHCDWRGVCEMTGFDIVTEERRFFDYWLKGIDNGTMDEDPIYYYTYNAPKGKEWQFAETWPLPEEKRVEFYLGAGTLSASRPTETNGKDQTTVVYDSKPGGIPPGALVYETAPLAEDVQVTGHPSIKLWVSSTATDGDFIATLRDVAPDGTVSSYNTMGQLRASMRKLAKPPYDKLGLPYHRFMEADATPLVPGKPTELTFSILPISMVFRAGHRIQLVISFTTRGTPEITPAPEVTLYHDATHPSRVTLPVIAPAAVNDPTRESTEPIAISVDLQHALGSLEPVWAWLGYDEPNYTYMPNGRKLLSQLAGALPVPVYVRAHNLLTSGDGEAGLKWGSTNAYTEDAEGKPVYDWTLVDAIFDTWVERGMRPLVEIGFMPEDLSSRPEPYRHRWAPDRPYDEIYTGWTYPPDDYGRWADLVYAWVGHAVERYGRDEVERWLWEPWNEPDIGYWRGSTENYLKLYDYTVDAVLRALPTATVGGPHTTGPSHESGRDFLHAFLDHVTSGTNYATGETGSPVHFIAFHAKGFPRTVDDHVRMNLGTQLRDIRDGFDIVRAYPAVADLPVIIGESDPEGCAACSVKDNPHNAYRNGTLYASYTAAAFPRKIELADRSGANLEGAVTWAFQFENQPWFAGFRALATNGVVKPVFNVFRMFGMMSGQRVAVHGGSGYDAARIAEASVRGGPDVHAFAARNGDTATVLLWNYHDDDLPAPDAVVAVSVTGVPVRRALMHHYRIDGTHSNAYAAWQAMGSPQAPTPAQYADLQRASELALLESPRWIDVSNGTAEITLALPRQGVSLIKLEW